jgi:hypothetical protein
VIARLVHRLSRARPDKEVTHDLVAIGAVAVSMPLFLGHREQGKMVKIAQQAVTLILPVLRLPGCLFRIQLDKTPEGISTVIPVWIPPILLRILIDSILEMPNLSFL